MEAPAPIPESQAETARPKARAPEPKSNGSWRRGPERTSRLPRCGASSMRDVGGLRRAMSELAARDLQLTRAAVRLEEQGDAATRSSAPPVAPWDLGPLRPARRLIARFRLPPQRRPMRSRRSWDRPDDRPALAIGRNQDLQADRGVHPRPTRGNRAPAGLAQVQLQGLDRTGSQTGWRLILQSIRPRPGVRRGGAVCFSTISAASSVARTPGFTTAFDQPVLIQSVMVSHISTGGPCQPLRSRRPCAA